MLRSRHLLSVAVLLLCSACGGAGETSESPDPATAAPATGTSRGPRWFEDVTSAAGIDFTHVRAHEERKWMPETISGGAGWLDFDHDGLLDLYCVQGGDPLPGFEQTDQNRLFRNIGEGKFVDVTEEAGVAGAGYGMGCAMGDYDRDGDTDIFVCNLERNALFRNEGDGTFSEVAAAAGVDSAAWSVSALFTDCDGDGDLDLFVVNYLNWSPEIEIECLTSYGEPEYCNPLNFNAPTQDILYRNEGNGRFVDITILSGISKATGTGLGCAAADYDADGDVDLYVTNDNMPNNLWLNDGHGVFVDEGLLAGCAVNMNGKSEAGMGVQAIDVENDGDWDLFMTHIHEETNTFFLNNGKGLFRDKTVFTGLGQASQGSTGFGLGFHDFNNDGELDLLVANGQVARHRPALSPDDPYAEPNHLFEGRGAGRFEQVVDWQEAAAAPGTSRAAAFADYDNDGAVDVYIANAGGKGRLLHNLGSASGRWIGFELHDSAGLQSVGARVRLRTADGWQYRLAHGGYSYAAANDERVHFGLADGLTIEEIEVLWPSGTVQTLGALETGRYHVLREEQR